MIALTVVPSTGFSWSRLPRNRGYELRLPNGAIGTLKRVSFWCSEYLASVPTQSWSFRRVGFWRTTTELVETNSGQRIAVYNPAWNNRGTLTFSDGHAFGMNATGFWRPVWTFAAAAGETSISLHPREKIVSVSGAPSLTEERLSLVMLFALYCKLRADEDAASAAVQ